MKTFATIALALSSFVAASAAQAQDRQVTVYSGAIGVELPASLLRGSVPAATPMAGDASSTRKVRVVLQSPYGN